LAAKLFGAYLPYRLISDSENLTKFKICGNISD